MPRVLRSGVPNIIVLDPEHRRQYVFLDNALRLVPGITLTLPTQRLALDLNVNEMFAELDEPIEGPGLPPA